MVWNLFQIKHTDFFHPCIFPMPYNILLAIGISFSKTYLTRTKFWFSVFCMSFPCRYRLPRKSHSKTGLIFPSIRSREGWVKRTAQLFQFLGSYALHTDPLVRGNLVCQSITLWTRWHVTDIVWQVDWVLVIASHCFQVALSAIASSELWLLFIKVQPFSLCWENFEERSVAN